MDGEQKPALVALRRRRDEVIDTLTELFSRDEIGLDEFELRLDKAHSATALAELDSLVTDLVPAGATAGESTAMTVPEANTSTDAETNQALELAQPKKKTFINIMSGTMRKGAWRVPKKMRMFSFMGGATLDFRDAIMPAGVTELRMTSIMGGVEIIVPPHLAVECDGWAIMGGFEDMRRAPAVPDPNRPLLRINGFSIMGGFSIETRLPGESSRDAHRRRKRERRQERKALRARQRAERKLLK